MATPSKPSLIPINAGTLKFKDGILPKKPPGTRWSGLSNVVDIMPGESPQCNHLSPRGGGTTQLAYIFAVLMWVQERSPST